MNHTDAPQRRTWTLLSVTAALLGLCGGLGTLITGFHSSRMGPFWQPGIGQPVGMFVCSLVLMAGLYFAVLATRRDASSNGLRVLCFFGNGSLLGLYLLAGVVFSLDVMQEAQNKARNEEQRRIEEPKREHDRKNVRLRLTYEPNQDWLKLTHVTFRDEFNDYCKVGSDGILSIGTFPPGLKLTVSWPEPRRFELTMVFDSGDVNLRLEAETIPEAAAWSDGKEIAFPIELSAGKHGIVIKGRCP